MQAADDSQPGSAPIVSAIGFVGSVDSIDQGIISGWAVTQRGEECSVVVMVNGAERFYAEGDRPRPDLAAKQQSRGAGGWRIDLRKSLVAGDNRIEVHTPDGIDLRGSPLNYRYDPEAETADVPMLKRPRSPGAPNGYLGAIDACDNVVLSGWAVTAQGMASTVCIQVNSAPPMEIIADKPRPDLAAKGLSDGAGGWRLDIASALVPGRNLVSITFPDGVHLPGSPIEREISNPAVPAGQPVPAAPPTDDLVAAHPSAASPDAARAPRDRPQAPIADRPSIGTEAPAAGAQITELPLRPRGPAKLLSLAELDELSLDDIALAVAAGMIDVKPAPVVEREEALPPVAEVQAPVVPAATDMGTGFFSRLWRRRR